MPRDNSTEHSNERHVFISHSSKDNEFGLQLERDLGGEPTISSVWYDNDGGINPGEMWQLSIEYALKKCTVFVVILSLKAIASPWVELEIRTALSFAISQNRVIIPVFHEHVEMPAFLAQFQAVDFASRSYEDAYKDLVFAINSGVSCLREVTAPSPYDRHILNPPEPFVGRHDDVAWILRRLIAPYPGQEGWAHIAAATGMGGIGKSALAGEVLRQLYAARQFSDGMAVVVCTELHDPSVVLRRVLSRFAPINKALEEMPLDTLVSETSAWLNGKNALIVLDNVEVGWSVDRVIAPLQQAGLAVLVTGREPLSPAVLPPEASLRLELLSMEDALQLFRNSYTAVTRRALREQDVAAAERIVSVLGRHTFAVRLAALQVAAAGLNLSLFAKELHQSPFAFDSAKIMTAILDSSYRSLSAPAQRLFVGMAVFTQQEVGRQAVHALASGLGLEDTEAMILRLIQLGLVDPFQNEDMPASSDYDRLRLHPLVMRFARELFMAGRVQNGGYPADSQNTAYTRMARYYIDYIRRLTPRDENDRDSKLYKALDPDEASIEAVLAGSRGRIDDESVVQLVEALWPYWDARFRVQTALTYMPFGIQAARRLASARPTETRQLRLAQLELAYAKMLLRADRWQEVNDELNRNLVIRRNLNDRRGEGIVRSRMAELALSQATEGCLEIAEGHLQKSISIHRQVGNLQGEIIDLQRMAEVSRRSADLHQARKWLEQALDVYKTPRPLQGKGVVLAELGRIAETVGNSDQAIDYYKAGLELLREAGDIVNIAGVALSLGESLVCNKKQREGCALIREAILLRRTRSLPNLAEAEEIANRLNCPLLQS